MIVKYDKAGVIIPTTVPTPTYRTTLEAGEPLSGKTTAILTWPARRAIIVCPGEEGHSSIEETDDTKVFYWKTEEGKRDYAKEWMDLRLITRDVLAGKFGEFQTVAIDGIHQAYKVIMKTLGFPDNEALFGEKAYGKGYAKAEDAFYEWISPFLASTIPYKVATVYDGPEAVTPGAKKTTIYPDLPGKMARRIIGSFPLILHCERTGLGDHEEYHWRLKATEAVQGVGVHLPMDIKRRLPAAVKQDWRQLEALIINDKELQQALTNEKKPINLAEAINGGKK